MKILHRYITCEILKVFFIAIGTFIFVLLLDRASIIAQTVLAQGVSILDFFGILLRAIPSLLGITIPMSFTLSVIIVTFLMAGNNEIIAMKSCGISPKHLLIPIIVAGTILTAATFYSLMFLMPQSNISLKKQINEIAQKKLALNIPRKSFVTNFPGVTFYTEKSYPDKGFLKNFMVSIKRKNERATIFAKYGRIRKEKNKIFLDIANGRGVIINPDKPDITKTIKFNTYTMLIYQFKKRKQFLAPKYKNMLELMQEDSIDSKVELSKRFTLSLTPFIMGILAFSIGLIVPRGSIGTGFIISLLIITTYYISYTFLKKLALSTQIYMLPIVLDIIVGAIAIILCRISIKGGAEIRTKW